MAKEGTTFRTTGAKEKWHVNVEDRSAVRLRSEEGVPSIVVRDLTETDRKTVYDVIGWPGRRERVLGFLGV